MPDAIQEVLNDIACLQCGYNLRGLRGLMIVCPECGWKCDLADLVTRRWKKPWWLAPGFNALAVPTAWLTLTPVPIAVLMIRGLSLSRGSTLALSVLVILSGWALLLARVNGWWPGVSGVILSALTAAVFAAYFLAIVALLSMIGFTYEAVGAGDWAFGAMALAAAVTMVVLGLVARKTERWIAQQCIRRYLVGL